MPTTSTIHDDGIAEVVMDNPPVNALTVAGWFDLADTLTQLGRDPQVRVVVLRGTAAELAPWPERLGRTYEPHRLAFAIPNDAALPGLLAAREPRERAVAYVCEGMTCRAPLELRDGVEL